MVTASRPYTYADLFDWPPDGDDRIYDLLGGDLVVRNAPDINHGVVLSELTLLLGDAQRAGYGQLLTDPHAVALDYPQRAEAALDVSHPDLFFIRSGREELWRGRRAMLGVPDLIVEVRSPSTAEEHAAGGKLWDAYERNGVPHYWIVDPHARTIEQFTLDGEPYAGGHFGTPVLLVEGDVLRSPLFPDISLPVATVFRNVAAAEPARSHGRRRGLIDRPHRPRRDGDADGQ
ncbi:MAG TPA: Uma2 family endonuclease [Chloroflexota bacterium]|jgi:Uma2 family endonuclease|nr:Uma2 family endonuclease [Chloroflexota bacterium]